MAIIIERYDENLIIEISLVSVADSIFDIDSLLS